MVSTIIGRQAIVVGAGIGGLAAAAALAPFFERVLLLERDKLPEEARHRPGTPQSRHPHGLLIGGLRALEELMPGFERQLVSQGAVRLRSNCDIRVERPGYDPFPQRDLGLTTLAVSRPAIDHAAHLCLAAVSNVTVRDGCRVLEFVAAPDGAGLTGVRVEGDGGSSETLPADLAIDASGRGALTTAFLAATSHPQPKETTIGVDLGYSTGVFEIPRDAADDWKRSEAIDSKWIQLAILIVGQRHAELWHSNQRCVLSGRSLPNTALRICAGKNAGHSTARRKLLQLVIV